MNSVNTTEPSQQYDLRILRALRRITRSIALHSRQLAAVSHITAPQLMCLRTVIANGPMTATAISREIHVSPSTVVGILDRLEDKGLIRRERGREDRRIVFVTPPTPAERWRPRRLRPCRSIWRTRSMRCPNWSRPPSRSRSSASWP
ncbi:sugar-specific transcriptional regulator, TrmB family [Bordetella hinzii 5132]|nr:sugar-specific transcriptional regulator, TrmB family [Bordetella hinzii 5132]